MDDQLLIQRLFQVVAFELRHKYYQHTVDKNKTYMQLVAGVSLDKLLKQYVKREDEALFNQRVALTEHIATSISENLLDVFYKVPRSNSARRVLSYTGDTPDEKVQEVEGILNKFWGATSWDHFLSTRFIELNATDPNAFVVFEWDDFDGAVELIQPRPYVVNSIGAIDYQYKNQVLQYLIAREVHEYDVSIKQTELSTSLKNPKDGKAQGYKYTLYGKNQTWQLVQVDAKTIPVGMSLVEGQVQSTTGNGDILSYVKLGHNYFQFFEFLPHNAEQVPAFRVGYLRDHVTQGETFVNPMHKAEPFLLKSIKTNSEFDLVATLLAFPQMLKYGVVCSNRECYGGKLSDGSTCSSCNGTGIEATAPSAQDAIVLPMPRSKEEMVPLNEILKYINPPVDIVKWQQDYIQTLTEQAKKFMFNSDTFGPDKTSKTATGVNLDMQNVYDTLYPFAEKFSRTWEFGVSLIAKLADREKGLIASYYFGKDFKLKSLDTLIVDAEKANEIGNNSLVRHINDDIARIIYAERPLEYQRYEIKELHNPFAGKSEMEILFLLGTDLVSKLDKILHANYGKILDELESESSSSGGNFYKLNRAEQKKKIYEKANEIMSILEAQNPAPSIPLGD